MKKGDKVVMLLEGAGVETASIQTVEKVVKGVVWLRDRKSHGFYLLNGDATENCVFGPTTRIVPLER